MKNLLSNTKTSTKTILFSNIAIYCAISLREYFITRQRDLQERVDQYIRTIHLSQQTREISSELLHNYQKSVQEAALDGLQAMRIEAQNKADLNAILGFMPRAIISLSNTITYVNPELLERKFAITCSIFSNLQARENCDISYMHFSDLMFLLNTASVFGMEDKRIADLMIARTNLTIRYDDESRKNFSNFACALIMHHNNLNYPGFEEAVNLHRIINISLDPARNHIEKPITHGSLPEDLRSYLEGARIIISKSMRLQLDIPENVAKKIWYYTVPSSEEILNPRIN